MTSHLRNARLNGQVPSVSLPDAERIDRETNCTMPVSLPYHPLGRRGLSAALAAWLLVVGCSQSSSPPGIEQTDGGLTAPQLLEKMRSKYLGAKSYTDNASLVEYSVSRARGVPNELAYRQISLAFARPNRLSVTYEDLVGSPQSKAKYKIAANGVVIRSAIKQLPQQIHEAHAPRELTPENFLPEPELRAELLAVSIDNLFPQLVMLLTTNSQQPIFPHDTEPRLLADDAIDGVPYHRIQLRNPAGKRVLWVDQQDFSLRRMELPIDAQRESLDPGNQFSQLSVWIDFQDVTFDAEIDDASFEVAIPEGGRRVRRFVPPPPSGPAERLGKRVDEFSFASLDGETVSRDSLAEKVVVLDFWSTTCPPCRSQTPVLEEVYEQFKDNDDIAFFAVSTDPPRVADQVVARTLTSWGGSWPIVRDPEHTGYYQLDVKVTPTLLLVGPDGSLQLFQPGAHRNAGPVAKKIQQLLDGVDLAAEAAAAYEKRVERFEQALDAATIRDTIVEVEIARPDVPPRRLPERLKLEQRWQLGADDITHLGDVLSVDDGSKGSERVLVLDGGQAIVELDRDGNVVARHELPEHEETTNGFIRSTVDGDGERWYVVSGVGWQQVFLFDSDWKSVLTFPDQPHSGIGDVLLADLAGSGTPILYVGYWGGLGVQGGSLDGRRLWSNRRLDHVLQITPGEQNAAGESTAWCTSTRGTVMQLTAAGKTIKELYVTGHALMSLASQPGGERHCGLSVGGAGEYSAVGFDGAGGTLWQYDLPKGEYVRRIPTIQNVLLPGATQCWQVAAADGSIHWLDPDGVLIDRFDYGQTLAGVTSTTVGDDTLLFVATDRDLTAWTIDAGDEEDEQSSAPTELPPTSDDTKE